MRLPRALKADIRFQFKQGFYAVYAVLTVIYMIAIGQLPEQIGSIAVPLVVFSDPSVVGFFFIGGIVMLEKVQGVLQYIAVTPLRTVEYLLAKVISLAILAVTAGLVITFATYKGNPDWILLIVAILLSSMFFTLYGFIAAAGCNTMNQYFIRMIPYMLLIILPCFSLIGFRYAWLFDIFPSVAGLKLVLGVFNGIPAVEAMVYILDLAVFDLILLLRVKEVFERRVVYGGEGR